MELLFTITNIVVIVLLIVLVYFFYKQSQKTDNVSKLNSDFLESIEKYIEIFNEQNVKDIMRKEKIEDNLLAEEKINSIREDYRNKLLAKDETLNEEHDMLIDFVSLSLSLLIKTPPTLREKMIRGNTDNEIIKKILISRLPSIENHYLPVSLLEVAISQNK